MWLYFLLAAAVIVLNVVVVLALFIADGFSMLHHAATASRSPTTIVDELSRSHKRRLTYQRKVGFLRALSRYE